jgi:putative ABC transport system substrate-binding protein
VLINPSYPIADFVRDEIEHAASTLGRAIRIVHVRSEGEIERAFTAAAPPRRRALRHDRSPLRHQAAAARDAGGSLRDARRLFLPRISGVRRSDELRPDTNDGIRKAAVYVGRILKGEQPAELPVQLPTKFGTNCLQSIGYASWSPAAA